VKRWEGTWPADCDICEIDLQVYEVFYDARTRIGSWALLCPDCFEEEGVGLGTGLGQKYDSKTLVKLEG
jgi:hypothetical protein